MQGGTDNEGYGALIYILNEDLEWAIGSGLPRPFHCPWCGALTKDRTLLEQ